MTDTEEFRVLLADPPWNCTGGGGRGAQNHYPLMKTKDIIKLLTTECEPVQRMHEQSVCYMWVAGNFLLDGVEVMEALDYKFINTLVWAKNRSGHGYYHLSQHELCLFGRRNKPCKSPGKPNKMLPSLIGKGIIPRREHSRKPDEIYEMIETMWDGPRLELFARESRPGWTPWGNETDKFNNQSK